MHSSCIVKVNIHINKNVMNSTSKALEITNFGFIRNNTVSVLLTFMYICIQIVENQNNITLL